MFEVQSPATEHEMEEHLMLLRYMAPNTRQDKHPRPRRRRHRIVDGQRAAAVRAFTGARLLAQGQVSSVLKAARACGSNPQYVAAAQTLLTCEDTALLKSVLSGEVGLLYAASAARRVSDLVGAYRRAYPSEIANFGRIVGVGKLFDEAISPAL
jgi:hypothetical protein